MLFDTLALLSFFICMLLMKRLVNVFPSLVACLWRGKECFNLESSVKLARDRNIIALALIVPFCLVAFRYRLYEPTFIRNFAYDALMGIYFGIFFLYLLLRSVVSVLLHPKSIPQKTYSVSVKASFTFFAVLTLILLAIAGVSDVFDVKEQLAGTAMLWVSVVIYILFLIRKFQIFVSSCSVFAAFLYLCALEIIPTGILVVSAMIF